MSTFSGNMTRCEIPRSTSPGAFGLAVSTSGFGVRLPLTVIVPDCWMSASALDVLTWIP